MNKAFNYTLKRKKLILLLGALGFSSYTAYKVYNSPSIVKTRRTTLKILSALASITQFAGDSAETLSVITNDLKDFIQSDSDQIPCSLKQVFKITKSDEVSDAIVKASRALTIGISRGFRIEPDSGLGFPDRALDKLFSPAGAGFVSVVVGSFSRNMVLAICADRVIGSGNSVEKWVDVITDDKFRKLIGDCIQQFVTTMVTVYLDKTIDVNTYDEIISGLTNPKHEQQVRNLIVLICNRAVETFVRTSHQVLTNSKSNGGLVSNSNSNANANANSSSNATSAYLIRRGSSTISKVLDRQELMLSKLKPSNIHGNMRFVLDLTGRVTLATVGFMLNQLSGGMKTSFIEAYKYVNARSLIVLTVWISLYLHMLSGPWSLIRV